MEKIKRIYFKLEGGLGNQFFQLAHALKVANYFEINGYSTIILYDELSLIKSRTENHIIKLRSKSKKASFLKLLILRFYYHFMLDKFLLIKKIDSCFLVQKHVYFYNYNINLNNNFIYIIGNWMSESYFLNIKIYLKNSIFLFDNNIYSTINKKILSNNSVAIHIRRGDYLSESWIEKLNVCGYEYYLNSINKLNNLVNKKLQFFVFTNSIEDISFLKSNYEYLHNSIFVTDNNFNTINDFISMTLCKYFIISNSTYSWWASYLANYEDKIIIAPKKWNNELNLNMKDIYIENWVIINND